MNEPQIRLAQDFSHQLYRNSAIGTNDKENTEYNLFSKAIETERLKDKESFGTYFKWHNWVHFDLHILYNALGLWTLPNNNPQ